MARGKPPTDNNNEAGDARSREQREPNVGSSDYRDCILIIEDNPLNMKLFRDLLRAQGYQVIEASDGSAGLELARAEQPDLILLDVHLPDMSGLDVAVKLKADQQTRDIPIVVVTASVLSEVERSALASGCEAFLRKPITISELRATIATLLQERRVRSGSEPGR